MYENYCAARDAKGYKDADVSRIAGITKSTFVDWKNGRSQPKQEKLEKIADCLDVSVDYLRTGQHPEQTSESGKSYYFSDETAKTAQYIYEHKDLRLLFDAARDADPADLKVVHDMLLALKRKEKGHDD